MPRIEAATLAEHRDKRRRELLMAGCEILLDEGPTAVTMAAVGQRTGLSRPGVYEYFTSTDDLLTEVLVEHLGPWSKRIAQRLADESDPMTCLRVYIDATLTMRAEGLNVTVPGEGAIPGEVLTRLRNHLSDVTTPLMAALVEMGIADPERTLRMTQAVVDAAARRIRPGSDPSEEINAATAFILAGIAGLDSASRPRGAARPQ